MPTQKDAEFLWIQSSKNNSTAEKMLESIKPDLDKEDKIKVIKKEVI